LRSDKSIILEVLYQVVAIDKCKEPKVEIRKTYQNVKPELLYDEIKDLALKQGVVEEESKLETYALPDDSSSFVSRGTLTFRMPDKPAKECLGVHIVGSARGETRVIFDITEELFPQEKLNALLSDLDFMFGSYEIESS
jgi:hypothetical protein